MNLLVKRGCDDIFQPLGELIKRWGRVPFLSGPTPPPMKVCEVIFLPVRISLIRSKVSEPSDSVERFRSIYLVAHSLDVCSRCHCVVLCGRAERIRDVKSGNFATEKIISYPGNPPSTILIP